MLVFLADNFVQFGNAGVRACLKGRLLMLLKLLTTASTWSLGQDLYLQSVVNLLFAIGNGLLIVENDKC